MLLVQMQMGNVTELFSALGEKGISAERVASGLARECKAFLKSTAPVGAYLSDQLMVPLALGEGGRYRTPSPLTLHAITNAEVIQKFLDVEITLIDMDDETSEITIQPSSSAS
jgi:RNA 3'-terminal phosphate cyclase (ATP)